MVATTIAPCIHYGQLVAATVAAIVSTTVASCIHGTKDLNLCSNLAVHADRRATDMFAEASAQTGAFLGKLSGPLPLLPRLVPDQSFGYLETVEQVTMETERYIRHRLQAIYEEAFFLDPPGKSSLQLAWGC
jgi:hypothetical protein